MNSEKTLFEGMEAQDAMRLFSDSSTEYRITFHCGRAEAQQRQRRGGKGEVTNDGYVRKTASDFLADYAEADENATVEVIN